MVGLYFQVKWGTTFFYYFGGVIMVWLYFQEDGVPGAEPAPLPTGALAAADGSGRSAVSRQKRSLFREPRGGIFRLSSE